MNEIQVYHQGSRIMGPDDIFGPINKNTWHEPGRWKYYLVEASLCPMAGENGYV